MQKIPNNNDAIVEKIFKITLVSMAWNKFKTVTVLSYHKWYAKGTEIIVNNGMQLLTNKIYMYIILIVSFVFSFGYFIFRGMG